jgi:hypothetical protein
MIEEDIALTILTVWAVAGPWMAALWAYERGRRASNNYALGYVDAILDRDPDDDADDLDQDEADGE